MVLSDHQRETIRAVDFFYQNTIDHPIKIDLSVLDGLIGTNDQEALYIYLEEVLLFYSEHNLELDLQLDWRELELVFQILDKTLQKSIGVSTRKTSSYEDAPLFSDFAIGYRSWIIPDYYRDGDPRVQSMFTHLTAGNKKHRWERGENIAICEGGYGYYGSPVFDSDFPHIDKAHDCGWNAFHTLDAAIRYRNNYANSRIKGLAGTRYITGAIAGYGNLQIHRDGWRGEKCFILGFVPTPEASAEFLFNSFVAKEYYDVPILGADELMEYAMSIGSDISEHA